MGYLKENKLTFTTFKITPEKLASLTALIEKGTINNSQAARVVLKLSHLMVLNLLMVKAKVLNRLAILQSLKKLLQTLCKIILQWLLNTNQEKNQTIWFCWPTIQKLKEKATLFIINELLKTFSVKITIIEPHQNHVHYTIKIIKH